MTTDAPASVDGDTDRVPSVADQVAAAHASIVNLDPDAVVREMEIGEALIVDVREPEEIARHGAIPGSMHAPRGMLEFYADAASVYHRQGFDRGRFVILYCASGARSALAVKTLEALGFDNVAHLEGGLSAWKAAGHRTTSL